MTTLELQTRKLNLISDLVKAINTVDDIDMLTKWEKMIKRLTPGTIANKSVSFNVSDQMLQFIAKRAEDDIRNGKVYTEEEMDKKIDSWL